MPALSRTHLITIIAAFSLLVAACGGGTDSLLGQSADAGAEDDGAGDDAADGVETPTEAPTEVPTATPEPEPTATPIPEPTATPEPTPTPTPAPEPSIIAVFADGTIDFDITEDNLQARFGAGSVDAANLWFESQGIVPGDVEAIHRDTLSDFDVETQDVLVPFMIVVTPMACEAGALGWNSDQFIGEYVQWNLDTQEGDPEQLRTLALAVGGSAVTAADSICPADTPTNASGNPQLPDASDTTTEPDSAPDSDSLLITDEEGFEEFIDIAATLASCSPDPTDGEFGAELDYQATLVALGFAESFDELPLVPVATSTCFSPDRTTALKFWRYLSIEEAVAASEPILVNPGNPDGSCWAVSAFFDILILGISAPGSSPTAVEAVNALEAFDVEVVTSGGQC